MRERIRRDRALFLVKGQQPSCRGRKPGAMRKFIDGYDVVQVWSKTEDEHAAALAVYSAKKWELVNAPIKPGLYDLPCRSVVRRKITAGIDDR